GVPCVKTIPGVLAAVRGIEAVAAPATQPRSIQEYHAEAAAVPIQGRLGIGRTTTGPSSTSAVTAPPETTP
ncbi:MAG: hypothetical protein WEA54_03490, partial [Actinomycetota bacterium]